MPFDHSRAPLVFGEALFDCFPDGAEVLGGAPFNVAWHLQAFGAGPLFLSRVGGDQLGDRIEEAMTRRGMRTEGLQRDPVRATGTVDITLAAGEPSYDIVADRAYDHIDASALPALPDDALLYHGTLALRNSTSADALRHIRGNNSPAVFVDVNLREPWYDAAQVHRLLNGARWVKLNADELALLAPSGDSPQARAEALLAQHELELVVGTLGAAGAFALGSDGAHAAVAPGAEVEVIDAVGAGDGFASVLILGLLRGWPLPETLERAQTFASAIVGRRGATVDDDAFYRGFAERWGL
ncbi:MAG: carbohydrate kinase [Thiohalocapsa sp.]|nr:carbohydrate kinase [Thiohalocapsa sp.]